MVRILARGTHSRAWYVFVLVRPQPHFEDRTAINISSDYNSDTSIGSRSVPRLDRSKISYFPRFVGREVSEVGPRVGPRVGPKVGPRVGPRVGSTIVVVNISYCKDRRMF